MHLLPRGPDILDRMETVEANLDETGVVLIRNATIDIAQFARISAAIGEDFFVYQGGANAGRVAVDDTGTIFLATGQDHGYAIPVHTEMYYLATRPELLFFYCEQPAVMGGETLLCDGPSLYSELPAAIQARFVESHIAYIRQLASGVWQRLYRTDSPLDVREICAEQAVRCRYDPATDSVTTRFACPAMVETPRGLSFSNNFLPFAARELNANHPLTSYVRFVDQEDQSIPAPLIRTVLHTAERLSVAHRWKRGDILVLDNRSILHGRPALRDTQRRILLRMAKHRRHLPLHPASPKRGFPLKH